MLTRLPAAYDWTWPFSMLDALFARNNGYVSQVHWMLKARGAIIAIRRQSGLWRGTARGWPIRKHYVTSEIIEKLLEKNMQAFVSDEISRGTEDQKTKGRAILWKDSNDFLRRANQLSMKVERKKRRGKKYRWKFTEHTIRCTRGEIPRKIR